MRKNLDAAQQEILAGNLAEAEALCNQVLSTTPNQPNALHMLGLIEHQHGRNERAISLLRQALKAAPDFVEAHNHIGVFLIATGRSEVALEHLEKAIALRPEHAEAHLNLGNCFHSLGRLEEAEKQYRVSLVHQTKDIRAYVSLSNLLIQLRRPKEALEYLDRALEIAPHSSQVHTGLGDAHSDAGNISIAIEHYRRALALDPDQPEANTKFGQLLKNTGQYDEAIKCFKRANTPYSRSEALNCLVKQQRYDEFFDTIEATRKTDGKNLYSASISAYVSEQLNRQDPHPYCPDPMKYVRVFDPPAGIDNMDEFLASLIEQVNEIESIFEPSGVATTKGFQSGGNLFAQPNGALAKLGDIIRAEATKYFNDLDPATSGLARDWPAKQALQGWFVRLLRGGHQAPHNHPYGWLSGCIYLQLPSTVGVTEGGIEFCLKADEYDVINNTGPTLLHVPKPGQLVMFPSSLFHRTIPFSTDEERICIAFDLLPEGRDGIAPALSE